MRMYDRGQHWGLGILPRCQHATSHFDSAVSQLRLPVGVDVHRGGKRTMGLGTLGSIAVDRFIYVYSIYIYSFSFRSKDPGLLARSAARGPLGVPLVLAEATELPR